MLKISESIASSLKLVAGLLTANRGAIRRRRLLAVTTGPQQSVECLEARVLPAIAGFTVASNPSDSFERFQVTFSWNDDAVSTETSYEVWVDQVVASGTRISRVLYTDQITARADQSDFQAQQDFDPGNYIAWVRKHDPTPTGPWVRLAFEVDDGNPATPLPSVAAPSQPGISVIREGQGAPGQTLTESRVGWRGEELLYDVWLNKRDETGTWSPYSLVRNVPSRSISYRHLSAAANGNQFSYFGQIDQDGLQQLETGDYRIFVRGVNAATDQNGNWVGRGPWSAGGDFSFNRIEGADAAPNNLMVTSELRPTVSWDAVEGAEAYTLSFWKGPDYANHAQIYLRINGTSYTPSSTTLHDNNNRVTLEPGDEFFVKVRAIGQDGSHVGFETGNFSSATVTIPQSVTATNLPAPNITGPDRITSDTTPILRWEDIGNADTYDVWFSSVQTGHRVFLATNIKQNALHLVPKILEQHTNQTIEASEYSPDSGLPEGRYRFWVRAKHSVSTNAGAWSSGYAFTVDKTGTITLELNQTDDPAAQPLTAPNLVVPYNQSGRQFLLVTNGKGETFGASVLARYELNADGTLFRPVVATPGGSGSLEFPDLSVGSNVAAMKLLADGRLIILSRGSGELHIVDPASWSVDETFALLNGSDGEFGDAINLEVLDNGQILVVFNRSDQLRIFEVDQTSSRIQEVDVSGAVPDNPGFTLPHGRGVQVSGVALSSGKYRLFVATPTTHTVIVYEYDPLLKTLTDVETSAGALAIAPRSVFSNPFHGGTTRTFTDASGQMQTFYFSADRQGFVTWVNAETLQYGVVDLAEAIPGVSRIPGSNNFADPNDNTFDATQIVGVDADHIAVFNNRQSSVLLKMELQPDGSLQVGGSSVLPPSYGGTAVTLPSGLKVIGTAIAPFSRSRQSSRLAVSNLEFNDVLQTWDVTGFNSTVLARPAVFAIGIGDDLVVEYAEGTRSVVSLTDDGTQLSETRLPTAWIGSTGNNYFLTNGATTTFVDHLTQRSFLIVTALTEDGVTNEFGVPGVDRADRHLLVIDVTDASNPGLFAEYNIGQLGRVRFATASAGEIILLDRQGGEMLIVSDWQTPDNAGIELYQFHRERIPEMGESRPGRIVIMPDGTRAVIHDTIPDRGVSVFSPGATAADGRTAIYHPNSTGSFAFDIDVFDADRIMTVNYEGDFVLLNLRTGVVETDQNLLNTDGVDINPYATENFSFTNGTLLVNIPSTRTVAAFEIDHNGASAPASPLRVFTVPDAVATAVDVTGYWIVETGRVHRIEF